MKSLKLPFVSLIIVILLNSIVLASPLKPAIIYEDVVIASRLVPPFTRWRQYDRFLSGERVVLFASTDEDNIWVLRLVYSIRHNDLTAPIDGWDTWLTSRTANVLNYTYSNVTETLPSGMEREERIIVYVEAVSCPAFLGQLRDMLKSEFNKHHAGILVLQGLKLEVDRLTLAEYNTMRERE